MWKAAFYSSSIWFGLKVKSGFAVLLILFKGSLLARLIGLIYMIFFKKSLKIPAYSITNSTVRSPLFSAFYISSSVFVRIGLSDLPYWSELYLEGLSLFCLIMLKLRRLGDFDFDSDWDEKALWLNCVTLHVDSYVGIWVIAGSSFECFNEHFIANITFIY